MLNFVPTNAVVVLVAGEILVTRNSTKATTLKPLGEAVPVMLKYPPARTAVGVPETTPVAELMLRPAGRELAAQVIVPVSPFAVSGDVGVMALPRLISCDWYWGEAYAAPAIVSELVELVVAPALMA